MKTFDEQGSVSWGTMREQDLVPVFLDVLEAAEHPGASRLRHMAQDILKGNWDEDAPGWDTEEMSWFVSEDLWDAMQDVAPPYCYFGAHPGDGADYGFWIDEDLAWALYEAGIEDPDLSDPEMLERIAEIDATL